MHSEVGHVLTAQKEIGRQALELINKLACMHLWIFIWRCPERCQFELSFPSFRPGVVTVCMYAADREIAVQLVRLCLTNLVNDHVLNLCIQADAPVKCHLLSRVQIVGPTALLALHREDLCSADNRMQAGFGLSHPSLPDSHSFT
jgi:hypothetical protein